MGSGTPKQYLALGGLPVLVHSLRVFVASESVTDVVLVVPKADREFCSDEIVSRHGFAKVTHIVAGGKQRQDSVRNALEILEDHVEFIVIHDAVRPFLTADLVRRVVEKAAQYGAAVAAIPMRDTVKQAGGSGMIEGTVDRSRLWLAQTPQAFSLALLSEAHRKAQMEGFQATDDAQLVERLGHRVAIVEGSGENIKITRPEDLVIGEAILAARKGDLKRYS
jgi:2-C-methyl-D-erythritol 4-phosphate cytidylyltransferase